MRELMSQGVHGTLLIQVWVYCSYRDNRRIVLQELLKRNKYVGILSIAVTTLQYIKISMTTIFSMYIAHVR